MNSVFELRNVTVRFERHAVKQRSLKVMVGSALRGRPGESIKALDNVSLRIHEGDHIGVIGRNGAGKSTLLRVLTRVIMPQEGRVHLNGYKHIVPLLELGIGFQPDLTGRENCHLAGVLMGYSREDIRRRIDAINAFAELGDFIDEPVKHYSSGMYARLGFALATDVNPEVLLVDEVFGVGDEFFMRKCTVRMQRLMDGGTTTVFVSHNLDFLVTQCNRMIWLDRGRLVMDGKPSEVATRYRAEAGDD